MCMGVVPDPSTGLVPERFKLFPPTRPEAATARPRRSAYWTYARRRAVGSVPMSLQVVPATGAILERVLDDTFTIWHDELSRENYSKSWAAQLRSPWGVAHLDRVALV